MRARPTPVTEQMAVSPDILGACREGFMRDGIGDEDGGRKKTKSQQGG
ncbi:hypothetical protein QQ056_08405 [Oscillatoria laete-virens NRMC-F 0139]|nr:hypothetical protein [Oscillatoria laete-virens]MDL5053563.1 hypothetical protein [Oscillatoria laete-virens NRMC-F 0139]